MKIRKIETKDNQRVKEIIQNSLKAFELDIPGTAYFDPQLDYLAEHYQGLEKGQYWVVEDNQDQLVACGGYGPFGKEEKIGELQKLYVDESAKGQGLSKLLMEKIIEEARNDYEKLYLETCKKLAVANFLYQKYEFELLSAPLAGSEHGAMDMWYIKDLH